MTNTDLFQTTDPQGRVIDLYKDTWTHIKAKHKEVKSFYEIKNTIQKPDFITENTKRKSLAYSKISSLSLYFNVYVGIEPDSQAGKVRTAFIQDTMPKGNVIWNQKG